jgi:hypothetical protein
MTPHRRQPDPLPRHFAPEWIEGNVRKLHELGNAASDKREAMRDVGDDVESGRNEPRSPQARPQILPKRKCLYGAYTWLKMVITNWRSGHEGSEGKQCT